MRFFRLSFRLKRSLSGGAAARLWRAAVLGAAVLFSAQAGRGAEKADTVQQQLQELRQANTALQEQLRAQKGLIETLSRQVGELQSARSAREQELADLKAGNNEPADAKAPGGINLGKLHITGEGGVGFFHTAREGSSPNSEFRVDEAKLFLEAPVWENVYVFSDPSGHYAITNVPPGTYKLKAWHERVPAQVKEITVPAAGVAKVDFVLGINNLPKY